MPEPSSPSTPRNGPDSALSPFWRRIAVLVLALLSAASLSLSHSTPAHATGSYDNASIATTALRYWNGHNGAGSAPGAAACDDARAQYGYTADSGGQCRAFVNCVVVLASGGSQHVGGGSDYFAGFTNAGGVRISDASALSEGDIVQSGQGVHTFIIVSVSSVASSTTATAMVVDSNHYATGYANPAYPETVSYYSRTFTLSDTERAYRMGTVSGPTPAAPPPNSAPSAAPDSLTATGIHASRVSLNWSTVSNATGYRVSRDGIDLGTTGATSYVDYQVSPGQSYRYNVHALNSSGSGPDAVLNVATLWESDNTAYLASAQGPGECGRAGDQSHQYLVCNLLTPNGWTSRLSSPSDWGYSDSRAWITNRDGSISYCRTVGTGDQIACDTLRSGSWSATVTSGHLDAGYTQGRAWLPTTAGPTECGRAGDNSHQYLVCNTLTSSGWISDTSAVSDWGYAAERAWIPNSNGTLSYCRTVGTGNQISCDTLSSSGWTGPVVSAAVDPGYLINRAWLPSSSGPTECGRAGDNSHQYLVCNTLTSSGWVSRNSALGDWGYSFARNWVANTDGSIAYCRLVGSGDQVSCDQLTVNGWVPRSVSPQIDAAYSQNRTWLATAAGPAECGRAGNDSTQTLVCTTMTSTGWVTSHSQAYDWGYDTGRAWVTNKDGSVSYCRRFYYGDNIACDRFNGRMWSAPQVSPRIDVGYADPGVPTYNSSQPADTTTPTVAPSTMPLFTMTGAASISFQGADDQRVASYDLRYRRAPDNGTFGAFTYPSLNQASISKSFKFSVARGSTYCLSVRSRDMAGNVSAWSAERCTSAPLDDRSLTASSAWARGTGSAYYVGTITSIAKTGATLTRTGVQARRLALVATTCNGCGTVGAYWNGTLLKTINLNATTTTQKRLITIKDFGKTVSGTLTIKTLNSGRTYIDGLATSRV